jgi:hypothetical protein
VTLKIAAIVSATVIGGCAGDGGTTHRFVVEVADGVETATNAGGPLFEGSLFTLHERLTLAQDPSDVESLLYQPSDFARAGDGNLYVADSGNHRIAVFDSAGGYQRSLGRAGQGPGEFEGELQLVPPFDREIQVFDDQMQRTQRFAFDGTLLGDVALPAQSAAELIGLEPDGGRLFVARLSTREDSRIGWARSIGVIPAGSETPIAAIETASMPVMVMNVVQLGDRTATTAAQIPFSGLPGAFRDPEGVVLVDGASGMVEWRDLDGTLRRTARVERARVAVSAAMRETYESKYRAMLDRFAVEGRTFPAPLPDIWYPDVAAWWGESRLDDRGFLWLQDSAQQTMSRTGDEVRYEILSPLGEYMGAVLLPFTDFRVQDGLVLARDTDPATDEVRLRVFELRPAAAGFVY